jgi:hypothetical protein
MSTEKKMDIELAELRLKKALLEAGLPKNPNNKSFVFSDGPRVFMGTITGATLDDRGLLLLISVSKIWGGEIAGIRRSNSVLGHSEPVWVVEWILAAENAVASPNTKIIPEI